ncbi:MAG: hypothetical protein GVY08_03095 [Bacteroidetes bacterium]|nr:hypothetical protein [Bacteroidota bacterium]
MSKRTGFLIVACLVMFIIFRVSIVFDYYNGDETEPAATPDLPAAFSGTLPCASCPGIEYHLWLEEEQFTEIRHYIDRDPGYSLKSGAWEITADTLKLRMDQSDEQKKFIVTDSTLTLLDTGGNAITGGLDDHYALQRNVEFQSVLDRHRELRETGVTFVANGNEPFWSIRVAGRDSLFYSEPGVELKSSSLQLNPTESGIHFSATIENNSRLEATAEKEYCRDTMSGFIFTHAVTVTMNGETTTGCGRSLQMHSVSE